ncbi:FAD-binding oxidoreductase [Motiliproteus sp. MSK22-1]|uniref:NAD(P)/FAD-dependent oxidoreductase n=1 Tax=Motiliproteus sp. MSK22-1 TaxID=1897630 RepID=UPI000978B28A|nr:FAD-dependent oxidoreductase [Motiliproteus sp. MSK22-1]OMH26241.1 amino acid dehydrogenase [Motiliproteus sp. MSK22-1]
MQNSHIGIIGAGVVGLSTALCLLRAGYQVTLIDKADPGMGASFGNAGLFADYARLPFARFAMMRKMPGMLLDNTSPLSMQASYIPSLMPYGWRFFKACFPTNYERGKGALTALQHNTQQADRLLLQETGSQDLVKSQGCLGLFATETGFSDARAGDLHERQQQGVNLQFLSADEVKELEPDLAEFHAGGVFYPDTRFTVSPVSLSRQYASHFSKNGGILLQDEVQAIKPNGTSVVLTLSDQEISFDKLVVCAGVESKMLLKALRVNIPLVSERGYHLTLNAGDKKLNRPVGWLDKAVFMTPMSDGMRLAGTAEFAAADAPLNPECTTTMLEHARVMLGQDPEIKSTWVGSRPSTPDSLPVIGPLEDYPQISLAFGHGHLGLTLGAITGQLISESIQGITTSVDLAPFAPARFN